MSAIRVPPPPAVFVGRDADLTRLAVGLKRVSVAVIYGVAGVGKSSLASAFAATWSGPIAYCRIGSNASLEIVYEDLLRQLLDAAGGALPVEPVEAAARELDERAALWIIDDLHRLAAEDQALLVRELGMRLRSGRVLVTSRQLLAFEPDGPDRLEVRLGGLDATSAQTLWTALDDLHGESPGFESLWSKARGNPLLLRQAHACRPIAEDHITAAVRALGDAERRIATALALCELPLPTRVVHALAGQADGHAALANLVTRMIVDPAGPQLWQLHDLFRESIVADVPGEVERALRAELATLLADAELDPVLRVREVCRHLRAVGRIDECAKYLLSQEPVLLREGATAELLRGLEAVPPEHRPPSVTVSVARSRARMLEVDRAHRELEQLVRREGGAESIARPGFAGPRSGAEGGAESIEAWLLLGQVALLRADLDTAASALGRVAPGVDPASLLGKLVAISMAVLDVHRGDGDAGRRRLLEAEQRTTDPDEAGMLVLIRGLIAWLDDEDDQLESLLRPNEWFAGCVAAMRANVVAPGLAATLCARLGRFDEAEAHFAQATVALRRDEELLSRVNLAFTRATIDFERGARVAADTRLRELVELHEQRGYVMGMLMCNALRARLLVAMGHRSAADALIEAMTALTTRLGVKSIANQLARARREDVLVQLAAEPAPAVSPAKVGQWIRARAIAAVRAAADGHEAAAASLIDLRNAFAADAQLVAEPGYGVERALARIATAITARLDGRETAVASELALAAAALADDGADPELVPAILDAVGRVRAITPTSRRLVTADRAEQLVATAGGIIADARSADIHAGGKTIALRNRRALAKLFFALASRPGTVWSKDALAQLLWGTEFDPLQHDNPLKVSITRLRALISDEMSVDFDDIGYRLAVPEHFLYLDVPGSNPG